MDDYLAKPLRGEQLDAVLERWLGGPADGVAAQDAAPTDGLVDEARLRTFRDDYPDFAGPLIETFASSTPPLLAALRAALAMLVTRRGSQASAHTMKGSCRNVGATAMAR